MAEEFVSRGGVIFEQSNAVDITPGEPNVITTDNGRLRADVVIQASGEPFWRNEIFAGRMWMKMSYALAAELEDPAVPGGDVHHDRRADANHPLGRVRGPTGAGVRRREPRVRRGHL